MAEFDTMKYNHVIYFVMNAHGQQMRAFTKVPYWTHPIRVANLVMKYKKSHELDNLVIAALLHDVVEDTPYKIEAVRDVFGDLVANLVQELTSDPVEVKKMGKTAYLIKKMMGMSSWGLVIKLCDRLDNVSDFMFAPERFIKKYGKETNDIIQALRVRPQLSKTHYDIIVEINRILMAYDIISAMYTENEMKSWRGQSQK
jgi:(p)ppGpp synthase/HD superfamily hydrolase